MMPLATGIPSFHCPICPKITVGGSDVIGAAKASMNLHDSFNVAQALFVNSTPLIDGTIPDDSNNNGGDRKVIGGVASTFDGVNQYFSHSGAITSGSITKLTAGAWLKTGATGTHYAMGAYKASGSLRSWLLGLKDGKIKLLLYSTGSVVAVDWESPDLSLNDDGWHYIGFNFDNGITKMFADGKPIADTDITKNTDDAISEIFTSTEPFAVAAYSTSSTSNGHFNGELQFPIVVEESWSDHDIAVFANDGTLPTTDSSEDKYPTFFGYLDGENCWDLTGNGNHLSPANNPTQYLNKDVPPSPYEFDRAGWSNPVSGLIDWNGPFVGGTTIRFKAKTSDDKVMFLQNTTGSTGEWAIGAQDGSDVSGMNDSTAIEVDGVEYTAQTRQQLYDHLCDDVEHDVIVTMSSGFADWSEPGLVTRPDADWPLANGYVRPVSINGEAVYASEGFVPAQLGSTTLDANGDPLQYSGKCPQPGQLNNAPCIDLGTNQYGTITNSDDFSDQEFTLRFYLSPDGTLNKGIFGQDSGSTWFRVISGNWATSLTGANTQLTSIPAPIVGKDYKVRIERTGSDYVFTVDNLTDGTSATQTVAVASPLSSTGDFYVGATASAGSTFDGKVWGIKLDHANGFDCPISDDNGTIARDRSGNDKHITWNNNPTWATQDRYFDRHANGFSRLPRLNITNYIQSPSSFNFDGIRTATIEIDFYNVDDNTTTHLYGNGNVAPFYIRRLDTGALQVAVRDASNSVDFVNFLILPYETYFSLRVVITEDESNPQTESTIRIYDLLDSENLLDEETGLDIALSSATSNSGAPSIGRFGSSGFPLSGIYRVKATYGDSDEVANFTFPSLKNNGSGANAEEDWNETGTVGFINIPAQTTDPTKDVFDHALTNPAGEFYDIGETIVPGNSTATYLNNRWRHASFNGTSSQIDLDDNFEWANAWSISFRYKPASVSGTGKTIFESSNNYYIRRNAATLRLRINGTVLVHSRDLVADQEHEIVVSYSGGSDGQMLISIDGEVETVTNDAASVTENDPLSIGGNGSLFEEMTLRNVLITNNGSTHFGTALVKNSLDIESGNANHGTSVDVTHEKVTDEEHAFGESRAYPESIDQSNPNYEKEFITFEA